MTSWRRTFIRARKTHWCLWCGERILAGSPYVLEEYADGAEHGRNRYHPECNIAQLELDQDERTWWNDEGCIPKYVRGLTLLQEHAEKENRP